MPEYLSPGVYVEEFEIGAKPIEGVSTSTAGFLGETERGPTTPRLVTSWLDYQRAFGGYFGATKYLPYAVRSFFDNGGQRCYVGRIVKAKIPDNTQDQVATTASSKLGGDALTIEAVAEGAWGNRVAFKVAAGTFGGFKLSVHYWRDLPQQLYDPDTDFKKQPRPSYSELYDDLSVDEASSDYYEKRVNGISPLIKISKVGNDTGAVPAASAIALLDDGSDGVGNIGLADYTRTETAQPGKRKGLTALEELDAQIIYAPNSGNIAGLTGAIITHCENQKYRFAIIDAAQSSSDVGTLNPRSANDTKYAAFYYPWVKIVDEEAGLKRLVPPGGFAAGIYARSDTERGVHKAPANEVVRGAVDLEFNITKGEHDVLNPRGVNVIRAFPGRGIRVWGARTLSSDPLWKYINVRRLFIFLEDSIYRGTQWVVFEPNDERLWARVSQTIAQFLTTVWRNGALMGLKEEEAFFVKADRSTMTQDDIDNGRLIVLIGVAPVKPAEFVIFRIAQFTANSRS